MMVPTGPLTDSRGQPTLEWRLFFQFLATAAGGPAFEIISERVNDATIKRRMRGSDGVWRESPPETLT